MFGIKIAYLDYPMQTKYTIEIRVFETDGFDYINDSINSSSLNKGLNQARKLAKQLGGKIKINVIDNHKQWIIYSKTYTYESL